jgi:hypothetical protein
VLSALHVGDIARAVCGSPMPVATFHRSVIEQSGATCRAAIAGLRAPAHDAGCRASSTVSNKASTLSRPVT